jgi:hypothetical protein
MHMCKNITFSLSDVCMYYGSYELERFLLFKMNACNALKQQNLRSPGGVV